MVATVVKTWKATPAKPVVCKTKVLFALIVFPWFYIVQLVIFIVTTINITVIYNILFTVIHIVTTYYYYI